MFANCIEDITGTSSKVKTLDSPLVDVETVTQKPRNLPFAGASIDRSTSPNFLSFHGMIVTNIDYTEAPTQSRPKRVTFKGSTLGGYEGVRMKAIFIKNLRLLDEKNSFEGDQMSVDEAYDFFQENYPGATPLFFTHGYNSEPASILDGVGKAQIKLGNKHVIVPIIWPCEGSFAYYNEDRTDNAPEAADELEMAFGSILKTTNKFKNKNLLCHSMGNYLLRKSAGKLQGLQFDNIIMLAADLRHNLFDIDFIDRSNNDANEDGLKIFRLLKQKNCQPVGKIYCVYNGWDYALEQSTGVGGNWVTRMGSVGVGTYDKWVGGWGNNEKLLHPEIRGHTENYDAGAKLNGWGDFKAHSYHWMDFMIDFYKSKLA